MSGAPRKRGSDGWRDLPVLGQARAERADAARNRRKILAAAERLVAARGVEDLSIDEVASEAGVGVGTLYRRFGDRVGLAHALLDEREREFQAAFLWGAPPLGPGAPPAERVEAFLHAYVDYLEEYTELHRMAEASAGARYRGGAYTMHHAHLATLFRQVCSDADAEYLADAILAPLSAELYTHQRNRDVEPGRVKAGLSWLVRRLTSRET